MSQTHITSEKLEATKVVLNDADGKSIFFIYGAKADAIRQVMETAFGKIQGDGAKEVAAGLPLRLKRKKKQDWGGTDNQTASQE